MPFNFLGTPLSKSTAGDFVPLWKQEARDEQGRKRFHGAFTGGFTAGYHNTVGSREGWAPTSFVSSRKERHSNQESRRRVEDFMDEEDLRELQRSTRLVTTETYATVPGKGRVQARRSGIGWELLRKMIAMSNESKIGAMMRDERPSSLGLGSSSITEDILTLPSPVMALLSSRCPPRSTLRERQRSTGIGVGVLGEDEEDDADEGEDLLGGHASSAYNLSQTIVHPRARQKHHTTNKISEEDRRGCLTGFVRATASYQETQYPSLKVPEELVEQVPQRQQKQHQVGQLKTTGANLSVEQRGRLLTGETPRVASTSAKVVEIAPQPKAASVSRPPLTLDVITALNAQRGFMPFTSVPEKDARYKKFLAHHASPQSVPLHGPPAGMTSAEYERELREFVQAATVFRPLPSQMASKFVRGKTTEIPVGATGIRGGLYRPRAVESHLTESSENSLENLQTVKDMGSSPEPVMTEKMVPATTNAEEGNETIPSRSEIAWVPAALLYKRFGVELPKNSLNDSAQPQQQQTASQSIVKPILSAQSLKSIIADTEWASKVDLSALAKAEEQEQEQRQQYVIGMTARAAEQSIAMPEREFHDRPSMDLFKSIFGDDAADNDESLFPPLISQDSPPVISETSSLLQEQPAKTSLPTFVEALSTGSLTSGVRIQTPKEVTTTATSRPLPLPPARVRLMATTLLDEEREGEEKTEEREKKRESSKNNAADDDDRAEGKDATILIKRKRPAAADLW